MGEPGGPCLDADALVAMIEGGLAADRVDAVVAHVDGCPSCAQVIATLGGLAPTLLTRDQGPSSSPRPAPAGFEGRRVGRYVLDAALGAGGMGIVYGAYDPELRRRVAIKLVRPEQADEASRARMLREARSAARISHPNVVTVHDVGEHRGHVFVATELVDGETLQAWYPGRPAAQILDAWLQAGRGLAAAHAEGVVHRDVKPSNVLVGRDGRVRIGDFGLATEETGAGAAAPPLNPDGPASSPSALGSSSVETATGIMAGTPAYMAPEHAAGIADPRSDQYSLCVGIVETLTGERPKADAAVTLEPPGLAAVLGRGLRADPAARFPSVDALLTALVAATAPAPPPARRGRTIAIAAGALAAIVVLAVWLVPRGGASTCVVAGVPADLWSPARRAAIAKDLAPNVAPRVDRWLATWSTAAADVCTRDGADRAVRERRQRCLAGELAAIRDPLVAMQSGSLREPWAVQQALDQLPRPAQCAHAAAARTTEPTPEQAAQIEVLRARMTRATASSDEPPVAMAVGREIVGAARALGYPTFTVEMLIALAGLESDADAAGAVADLRRAVEVADAAGEPWTRLTAALALLDQLGGPDVDEAARVAEVAHALIAELGGDPVLDAEVDVRLGAIHRARDDFAATATVYDRARRALRAGYQADSAAEVVVLAARSSAEDGGPRAMPLLGEAIAMLERFGLRVPQATQAASGDPDALIADTRLLLTLAHASGQETPALQFSAEVNFANAYRQKHEPERALRHFQRAATIGDRLGLDDVSLAEVYRRTGALLVELRRPGEAVAKARRALELAEALAVDAEIAEALTVLGAAQLELGDPTAHEPLARALAIRDRLGQAGINRGRARFLLARALPAAARAQARDLGRDARADYQRALDDLEPDAAERAEYAEQIEAIDRWLDDHP